MIGLIVGATIGFVVGFKLGHKHQNIKSVTDKVKAWFDKL